MTDDSGGLAPRPEPRARGSRSGEDAAAARVEALADVTSDGRWRRLGQLIPGLTHELKNPLAVVQGYGQLLLEGFEPGSQEREDVECLLTEVTRVVRLVDDLQAYARPEDGLPSSFDVSECLASCLALTQPTLRDAHVAVAAEVPEGGPHIRAPRLATAHALVTLLCVASAELAEAPTAQRVLRIEAHRLEARYALRFTWAAVHERLAPAGLGELQACARSLEAAGSRVTLPSFQLAAGQQRSALLDWPTGVLTDGDVIG